MTTSIVSKSSTVSALQVNGVDAITFDATGIDSGLTIGASVAANAITVTLNPCGLRFRNTTLNNGTPAYVTATAQLSLTIAATDSFAAVTAGGTQRIAILAINNAGVMELAASNLAGGVALDETGVITTAATATTATAIKASGVRTGVAYRVVGFVDVPFTTGTGYGAIVTVQTVGGQALAAMSSLGYGQTWQNVTGSRTSGTTYYNTTGRPIVVSASAASAGISSSISITVSGFVISTSQFSVSGALGGMSATAVVPPGASYVIVDGGIGTNKFELR